MGVPTTVVVVDVFCIRWRHVQVIRTSSRSRIHSSRVSQSCRSGSVDGILPYPPCTWEEGVETPMMFFRDPTRPRAIPGLLKTDGTALHTMLVLWTGRSHSPNKLKRD